MADLDDFFAKKDRKKAKNIKKFSTADEIAKKLEDTGKKVEKPIKKDRSNQETDESRLDSHVCIFLCSLKSFVYTRCLLDLIGLIIDASHYLGTR